MLSKQYIICFGIVNLLIAQSVFAGGEEQSSVANVSVKQTVLTDPGSAERGNKKFHSICAYCHGSAGKGGKGKKLQGRNFEADFLFKRITEGLKRGSKNMPSWRKLPEKTRWELVAYIMSLKDYGK